jgi:hypothetical protein
MSQSLVQASLVGLGALLAGAIAALVLVITPKPDDKPTPLAGRPPIPIAVLGDSDSKSYHDTFTFGNRPGERGGVYRPTTYNWIEVLARLRGDQFDPGDWGLWGMRSPIAHARDLLGMPSRLPRAEEYRYNFAYEGAVCEQLLNGERRQTPRLLELIGREGKRWDDGLIVIRIGINTFGGTPEVAKLARDPAAPDVVAGIAGCLAAIEQSIKLIRADHPQTRIVVVGIFNEADWSEDVGKWQSAQEMANINAGLDRFDNGLRQLVARYPRLAFFDDRAWFASKWGTRDPTDGKPAYHDVVIGKGFHVRNTTGDPPSNSALLDGHAGAVWHALWCQSLVNLLNEQFQLGIRPIQEDELVAILDPNGTFGMK